MNSLIKCFFHHHSYGFTLKRSLIIDSLQNLESIKRSCESKNLVHTFQRYFSGEYHFHCDCYLESDDALSPHLTENINIFFLFFLLKETTTYLTARHTMTQKFLICKNKFAHCHWKLRVFFT